MAKRTLDIPSVGTVDETAAEFLRAQEVRRPLDIEELQQATTSANDDIERVLFHRDRWRGMKEGDAEESSEPEGLYDEWVDVMLDLEDAFIDENDGALGKRVIALLALDPAAFAKCAEEALFIVQQTTPMALRVYPFTHRLVDIGVAHDRTGVVERLSSGDLVKQEKVHNVSVTPRRRTIIGLLRDLDARLSAEQQTDIWSLEVAPELPATAVISDPFQSGDENLSAYWRQRISAAHEMYGGEVTILSLSGEKTTAAMYELENIAESAGDDVLKKAARSIATWLEGKQMYYTDPDPRDFELYHLGMEDPQQLMEIMRSLDVIKHLDPELFFELIGIDPSQGGRSLYFGSFLHKALYNTQRTIDQASPEIGTMAIQTMMSQLLTLDERVQTYSAVVSQESLKAMAGEMKKSVDSSATPQSKAQALMMMAVPFSRMAIDAEVRRQHEAMREASPENIVEELRRRIDDIEHPLKLADYLKGIPKHATDNVAVRRELRKILSEEQIDSGAFRRITNFEYGEYGIKRYKFDLPSILPELYNRIPLIDETRDDLGFALRIRVAIRDAVSLADSIDELRVVSHSEKTRARQFLKFIMPDNLYREDFEAVKDQLRFWEIRTAERFNYALRSHEESVSGAVMSTGFYIGSAWSKEDKAFFLGQAFVGWGNSARDRGYDYPGELLERAKEYRPDLVFLSIIAHPQGKEIAFKYFDKFCEIIPAERIVEMLKLNAGKVREFLSLFNRIPSDASRTYLEHLKKELDIKSTDSDSYVPPVGQVWRWSSIADLSQIIEPLRKINKTILAGGTPWEIQTGYRSSPSEKYSIDLFDVYESLVEAYIRSGRFDEETIRNRLANPDIDPPTEEQLREMMECYKGPETSNGSDFLHIERLEKMIVSYLYHGKDISDLGSDLAPRVIREKIVR